MSPNGRLAITDWRKCLPIGGPRADLDTFLRNMARKEKWESPDIESLKGEPYKGLTELRWRSGRLPHRIFGYELEEHHYLMLVGCTHKDTYDPPGAWDSLLVRRKQIQNQEATYIEYSLIANRRTEGKGIPRRLRRLSDQDDYAPTY